MIVIIVYKNLKKIIRVFMESNLTVFQGLKRHFDIILAHQRLTD